MSEQWKSDRRWAGQVAFVIASGPSLRDVDLECLRSRHTIVCNSTCLRMPWAEVLLSTDTRWFQKHVDIVASWAGEIITPNRQAKRIFGERIKLVDLPWYRFTELVHQGPDSGHTAISVAALLGATTIVLLGFDMHCAPDGRSHEHDDYDRWNLDIAYRNHNLPAFRGMNRVALDNGITIFNATVGSALTEFPMIDLREFLANELATKHGQNKVGGDILATGSSVAG